MKSQPKKMNKKQERELIDLLSVFASRLKNARNTSELTQKEAAELLGIGRTKYQEYERGEQFPRYDEIRKICRVFKRNEFYFFPQAGIQYKDDIYTQRLDELNKKIENIESNISNINQVCSVLLDNQKVILSLLKKSG